MRPRIVLIAVIVMGSGLVHAPSLAASPKSANRSKGATPAPSALTGLQIFSSDGAHSAVQFAVPWMGLTRVHGSFSDIRATLAFDSVEVTRSSISVVVMAASLDTGNEHRDKDLKSADWFDIEKYPRLAFRSTAVERSADGLTVGGDLTIRDVTRPVVIRARDFGLLPSPFGPRRAFSGAITVDRKDYGLVGPERFNALQAVGKKLVGDEVVVELELQVTSQAADRPDGPVIDSLESRIAAAGLPAVFREYRAARALAPHPDSMLVEEGALNGLGHRLLRHGRADQAIEVFGLEAESFPNSAFAEVGLGQAYAVAGRRDASAEHCRRALQIAPNATRAMEILRRVGSN